jgi:FKBP-type peptidyl-prolyl cis-trans isomerase
MNKTGIGIIAFIFLFGAVVYFASSSKTKTATDTMTGNIQVSIAPQTEETSAGEVAGESTGGDTPMDNPQGSSLGMEDSVVGTGAEAVAGKKVSVHYTGTLTDGTKFDSSVDRGQPFTFTLGQGEVIQGWDQGVAGMKVGGKRKLTIPPSLGYGSTANGPIPANSTLLFDVELLGVE